MDSKTIAETFSSLVSPSHPNEWEIEEVVDCLEGLVDPECRDLLQQVPAIWPVSHSLCYAFLRQGAGLVGEVPRDRIPEWVRQVLYHYESGGLRSAEVFMAETHSRFLDRRESGSEVVLDDVRTSMQHYIRGVASEPLRIGEDSRVWTDTETIYLPKAVDFFPLIGENKLFYKFLVTYQWVIAGSGVFATEAPWQSGEDGEYIYLRIYLFSKACPVIRDTFPGLWRRIFPLLQSWLGCDQKKEGGCSYAQEILAGLWRDIQAGESDLDFGRTAVVDDSEFSSFFKEHAGRSPGMLERFYTLLLGELDFARAHRVINERREDQRQAFITMLARILPDDAAGAGGDWYGPPDASAGEQASDVAVAALKQALKEAVAEGNRPLMRIDNINVTVPDELVRLAEKMMTELGDIPLGYIQAAAGLAGAGLAAGAGRAESADLPGQERRDGHVYDEWDCRRNGYRRDWCTVIEEDLPVTRSNFIPRTLEKYAGLRKRLRAQFEMMATAHRLVRRQRDGDELDLDAIIDAMGDSRAGKAPDDRLFIRLLRNERSITTLFLIDMSNSTSGWIGKLIKESLVLLCEAMEEVGDSYGIYGFSGMKRSSCKLYHIKGLGEPYDDAVRARISAVTPKDYTRMAPAVRHLATLLENADTRSRLLITLSDGKPEDYDGYYGEYAVEDTRKALLEARGVGISPFCITIDKQAHDYLEHMFGAGNYTFINRIESLPARVAQIYRALTR